MLHDCNGNDNYHNSTLLGQILQLFDTLCYADVESIGDEQVTSNAKILLDIINSNQTSDERSNNVINNVSNDNYHCFWAGMKARQYLLSRHDVKTDYDYTILCVLFELCGMLRQECNDGQHSEHMTIVSYAISACYATLSTGIVNVYISSDKQSESGGLTLGTNFWEAELYTLQKMRRRGLVTDIIIYTINHDGSFANDGISVNIINIPIWRRQHHPTLDSQDSKQSFVTQGMTNSDYDNWRLHPPRNYITVNKVRHIIAKWRSRTSTNKTK